MAESVLIVDDEKDLLEIMAERLRTRGMNVSTTTSALDALKMAQTESYDVVVLDLMMPEMDGFKALKALKRINPAMRIILLTGFGAIEKELAAMHIEDVDIMDKPPDLGVLVKKIKMARAKKKSLAKNQTGDKNPRK